MTRLHLHLRAAAAALAILAGAARAQTEDALLLWDGDAAAGGRLYYGTTTPVSAAGRVAFDGRPDPWHEPAIGLDGLSAWRADLSAYDEIWLYARADQPGRTFDFSVYAWPQRSRVVNVDAYTASGRLDTTWQLVRIPVDSLATADFGLQRAEILYFGKAQGGTGHHVYVDEVRAVRLTNTRLWTGEEGGGNTFHYGSAQAGVVMAGRGAFEGVPDRWHAAGIGLDGLPAWRADLRGYQEIWFYARADQAGRRFDFSAYGWPQFSRSADIGAHTVTGQLDTTWQLVRIPVDSLTTPDYSLDRVEILYFGKAQAGRIYVDDVRAVRRVAPAAPPPPVPPAPTPQPEIDVTPLALDFGAVAQGSGSSLSVAVANRGTADLVVGSLTSSDSCFAPSPRTLTLAPGDSARVSVAFRPDGATTFDGVLTLASNDGDEGVVNVALAGLGLEAVETLSLWNGEVGDVAAMDFYYGAASAASPHEGSWAFRGDPDAWHEPGIGLGGLPSWRADLRGWHEIRFWARADQPGRTFDFSVYGWPERSRRVNVDPYVVGGAGLDTTYREVRIPVDSLATSAFDLQKVEILYFGTAQPTSGHHLYVDAVRAVRPVGATPPDTAVSGGAPPPDTTGAASSPLALTVTGTTSSSVSLSWPAVAGAQQVRVYFGPEPGAGTEVLPVQVQAAALPGDATACAIPDLAAAVDVFVRVEAVTANQVLAAVAHARTRGGPREPQDTPLQEVHAYGPAILQVVVRDEGARFDGSALVGNRGAQWQAGPWTVQRGDGRAVAVTGVFRQTVPAGQPDYAVGYGAAYDDNVVDLEHRLYLILAEALGTGPEVLTVTGPLALTFRLPFSDRYLETPVIQLNQVGYHPAASRRWAYVSGWMGDGGPLSLAAFPATAQVLAEPWDAMQPRVAVVSGLGVAPRTSLDSDAGAEVRQIDLSTTPAAEGVTYRIRLPGVGVSWATAVSRQAAEQAGNTVVRGLLHNRWGADLRPDVTAWSRGADHPTVYTAEGADPTRFYASTTPLTGPRPLVGGYHDAGDFDQRPMHVAVAQLLLRAFELNPAAFGDGDLQLPESGNGLPDLLDEALWGVSGWEQLQEGDGGVRSGVESYRHPWGYYFADTDPLPYWTYARDANHTARVAGVLAQASRLAAPYDAARAARLQQAARSAFAYAVGRGAAHPNLLYAAGELFRLTGETAYKMQFEASWAAMGTYGAFSNFATTQFYMGDYFNNKRAMPDFILGYEGAPGASSAILTTIHGWLGNYASSAVSSVLASPHGHRNPRPSGRAVDWGNGTTMGRFLDTVYGQLQMGGVPASQFQDAFDALSLAADYALGGNPEGRVYFTGMGARRVEEPLHLDALAFIKGGKGPIPGIPVYGPVESVPAASYYAPGMAAFYPAMGQLPRMRRFADLRTFVVNTEFTVWETMAPHAELFAAIQALAPGGAARPAGPAQVESPARPAARILEQNYPNPFNPSTTIRYHLAADGAVTLVIYNALGQQVRSLVRGERSRGTHSATWEGRDDGGHAVAPGVYFFRLTAGGQTQAGKMVLAE